MRLDRLVSLNLVRPLRRITRSHHYGRAILPILMYHSISDGQNDNVSAYYRVETSPDRFSRHMELLSKQGFRGVTLTDGLEWLSSQGEVDASGGGATLKCNDNSRQALVGGPLPIAITFDDGLESFFTEAFPVMQRFGFGATMFLPTAFIGKSRRAFSPRGAAGKFSSGFPCLTWDEVTELHSAGMEFGTHTVNHPRLVDLSPKQIESELRESKHAIEDRLQCTVETFAYPYAFPETEKLFVRNLSGLLATTGYKCCVTTRVGRARLGDDVWQLRRLPMNSCDDDALLLAKLYGDYDWLAGSQRLVKKAKSLFRHSTTPASASILNS